MDNISNAQMKIRPKAIKELKKQQKDFKKIQKLINDTLVGQINEKTTVKRNVKSYRWWTSAQ